MLPFDQEFRTVKSLWASGLLCLKDRKNSLPLWKALIRPPKESTSHFTVFQVAWGNGQSGPPCPPGKVFLIFISPFNLLFSSKGERIKLDFTQSTLGLLRSPLKAGKEDFKSTGFPTESMGSLHSSCSFIFRGLHDISLSELSGETQTGVKFLFHTEQSSSFPWG